MDLSIRVGKRLPLHNFDPRQCSRRRWLFDRLTEDSLAHRAVIRILRTNSSSGIGSYPSLPGEPGRAREHTKYKLDLLLV